MRNAGTSRRPRPARIPTSVPRVEAEWAYFFDIDGTLVDIADSPSGVRLERGLMALLERLSRSTGGAVALISGRSIADIDQLFPGTRMPAAGQHGIERRDTRGRISRHVFPSEKLLWVRDQLAEVVARHRGLLLEDKGLSLALHYRRRPRLGSYVHRLMRSLQVQVGAEFCVQTGKRVVELRPAARHKGGAVLEFMQEEPFRGRRPVFVGDDVTDEFGFAVVNRLKGLTIKVGPGRTVARWRLPDVRAVRAWLRTGLSTSNRGSRESEGAAL